MFLKTLVALCLTLTIFNSNLAFSITQDEAKAAATLELLKEQKEKEVREAIDAAKRDIVKKAPTDYGWGNPLIGAIMFLVVIGFLSKSFFRKGSSTKLDKLKTTADHANRDLQLARLESIQANKDLVKKIVIHFENMDQLIESQNTFDTDDMDDEVKEAAAELKRAKADLLEDFIKGRPQLILKLQVAVKELLDKGVELDDIPKYEKVVEILNVGKDNSKHST